MVNKKLTVYFEPSIYRALKYKAAALEQSLSTIVNETLRYELQQDQEDLKDMRSRMKEPTISYQALLKKLKAAGKI